MTNPKIKKTPPACLDCAHASLRMGHVWICELWFNPRFNPVTGRTEMTTGDWQCSSARVYAPIFALKHPCGPKGKMFKQAVRVPVQSWWRRLLSVFAGA